MVYMDEGTVVKARDDGEVILIGASDRYVLNEKGENREKDDIDYFLQLFGIAEERKFGVYTAEMSKSKINIFPMFYLKKCSFRHHLDPG